MASVKIKVDGREIAVEKGTNLIEAAKNAGVAVPHFCYHPGLPVVGVCRICLCELEGRPKLVAGCATQVEEGMHVITRSAKVADARRAVMEFLLIHHPLDCPMCDKGGECTLQDYTMLMGPARSRFKFEKITWPEEDVGGKLVLNKNRCILCMRCVNLCKEVAGLDEIAVLSRGEQTYIGTVDGRKIENELAGNIADICPVGALTSKDFRFRARPWELTNVSSVCPHCSKGCNITVGYHPRRNEILRITARTNMDVNQWWICDRGRGGFHFLHDPKRLLAPARAANGTSRPVPWKQAILDIAQALRDIIVRHGARAVGVVGSGTLTNEECYLTRAVFKDGLGVSNVDFPPRPQPEVAYKKFTIEGDKDPNARGAALCGVAPGASGLGVRDMMRAAAEGTIKALVFLRGGPLDLFGDPAIVERALQKVDLLLVVDFVPSPVSDRAHWVLPGVTFAEKEGTFTNSNGRVQRIRKVLTIRGDTREDWRILQDLGQALGVLPVTDPDPERIFLRLAQAVPAFSGLSYSTVGELGAPIAAATADVAVG
ncbi:MAG: 2Fe-2S iron-sulfur cluster binding domain-containing protein [Candidatus Eisenbacteria bacterium]|uniref:2Fe-2S iron-sulfur cluster binding domain-containing protein n=1 Tax=Eiseniibacteriota bacterium TaxID=2212470 RepID=A0A538TFH5_UNCEI|nr:MAG: 2Fe-2S iron-sulfur cluster binding domain-containing protein [Candidatus Eisenbacteria bacterium]TMQ62336.1 MAG: 2Fe-2S iron-sulfur cluster binding domain-containing protein [Candidatus Eisenbacteria bacterium]